jgi:hypothetical protein
MRDVTERVSAQEALQHYTERLRALRTQLAEVAEPSGNSCSSSLKANRAPRLPESSPFPKTVETYRSRLMQSRASATWRVSSGSPSNTD